MSPLDAAVDEHARGLLFDAYDCLASHDVCFLAALQIAVHLAVDDADTDVSGGDYSKRVLARVDQLAKELLNAAPPELIREGERLIARECERERERRLRRLAHA